MQAIATRSRGRGKSKTEMKEMPGFGFGNGGGMFGDPLDGGDGDGPIKELPDKVVIRSISTLVDKPEAGHSSLRKSMLVDWGKGGVPSQRLESSCARRLEPSLEGQGGPPPTVRGHCQLTRHQRRHRGQRVVRRWTHNVFHAPRPEHRRQQQQQQLRLWRGRRRVWQLMDERCFKDGS